VINAFSASDEYKQMYAGKTEAEVVNQMYRNLFGRDAEEGGLKFWTEALAKGAVDIGNMAITMAIGAQGDDAKVVVNKVEVAEAFTLALDTPEEVNAYSGAAAAQLLRQFLAKVDASPQSVAAAKQTVATEVTKVVTGGGGGGGGGSGSGSGSGGGANYTLTTGTDTIAGTGFEDTITGTHATLRTGDTIVGGAGTDILNLNIAGPLSAAATRAVTVDGVEIVNIRNRSHAGTIELDLTGWTGVQAVAATDSPYHYGAT